MPVRTSDEMDEKNAPEVEPSVSDGSGGMSEPMVDLETKQGSVPLSEAVETLERNALELYGANDEIREDIKNVREAVEKQEEQIEEFDRAVGKLATGLVKVAEASKGVDGEKMEEWLARQPEFETE